MSKDKKSRGISVSQWRLFGIVFVIGLCGLFFHVLHVASLHNSAALYVGLPVLFALGLSLTPKTKSTMGATMKGLTIALLLSAPVFKEGFICIIIASPILYSIAGLVAYTVSCVKKRRDTNSKLKLSALTVLLGIVSLEGTHEVLTFERYNQVEYSHIVDASMNEVRAELSKPLTQNYSRSLLLSVFPLPVNIEGSGLNIGDERHLDFVYNKWIFANTHEGSTVFRVSQSQDNYIRFDISHDDSYISNYLTWTASEIFLEPVSDNATKVTWRLSYERKLDPIWYFGPIQKYAVWLTAKSLVNNNAIPVL